MILTAGITTTGIALTTTGTVVDPFSPEASVTSTVAENVPTAA